MNARGVLLSCLVCLLLSVKPAVAQAPGISGYFTGGVTFLEAAESFDAVAGTSQPMTLGGGAHVSRIWHGVFADFAITRSSLDGERVFVSNGNVFRLGIPWEARMQPIDLAAGWRFRAGSAGPYVGAGVTFMKYTEESDFAQSGDNVDVRKAGPLVLAGFDVPVGAWVRVGVEARYRRVSGVLGDAGVSKAFNEDQLGGASTAVRVSVGR